MPTPLRPIIWNMREEVCQNTQKRQSFCSKSAKAFNLILQPALSRHGVGVHHVLESLKQWKYKSVLLEFQESVLPALQNYLIHYCSMTIYRSLTQNPSGHVKLRIVLVISYESINIKESACLYILFSFTLIYLFSNILFPMNNFQTGVLGCSYIFIII